MEHQENKVILIHVTYKVKPGMRDEFIKNMMRENIIAETQSEEGNLMYRYHCPVDDQDEILLVEAWRHKDDIKSHLKTHHAARLAEIKRDFILETIFRTYKAVQK